jgi:hypothetical protein
VAVVESYAFGDKVHCMPQEAASIIGSLDDAIRTRRQCRGAFISKAIHESRDSVPDHYKVPGDAAADGYQGATGDRLSFESWSQAKVFRFPGPPRWTPEGPARRDTPCRSTLKRYMIADA